ncbi:FAD-dependent oxidoreductase [Salinisphaera hydrothermalis]|uniref:NADH dehydrogenase-like protein / Selenide,water dikinase n=1 Tax=Salinisphaera hydrothermalis (strain C41B8) TaxID=1304275 RepID=A0A084IK99_SALHC|nr:FAD-dependent oxidoreductase [Salinisphaera hydrothermalis]KEZ77133.1 NADH dehydrogenase-like protein / Selenide,water dikinase [Salinisphaera hydrothermalis C41B8]
MDLANESPRLVLTGAGHAHVELLRRLALRPALRRAFAAIDLIEPEDTMAYSGLLPATVAGHYARHDMQIDVAALARLAAVNWHRGRVTRIDATARRVHLADGTQQAYDLLSLNIGTEPPVVAGDHQAHVVPVKPVATLWRGLARIEHRLETARAPLRIAVIGGGAGGVELALALAYRWRRCRPNPRIDLYHRGPALLGGAEPAAAETLAQALCDAGIGRHPEASITRIASDTIASDDGRIFPADAVVLATGAATAPGLGSRGLVRDAQGFVRVDATLRSVEAPEVFAAGDIASLPLPRPKSGVFAVRAAPVLADNIERTATGRPLRAFEAQPRALALIGLGARRAVAARGWPIAPSGYAVWRLKQAIDQRFIERYDAGKIARIMHRSGV